MKKRKTYKSKRRNSRATKPVKVYSADIKTIALRDFRGSVRILYSFLRQAATFALAFLIVLGTSNMFSAFEAYVINTTAVFIQIDPPVIDPPGGEYDGPIDVTIYDNDIDATHIFYTVTPGTDPSLALDPSCGIYPGGPKPIGPFTIYDDSVVKAIACDGDGVLAHGSSITVAVYDLTLLGKIEGRKYHDLDESGTFTDGDFGIEGWQISLLSGTTTIATTATNVTGYYAFNDLDPDTYVVEEEMRDGWTPTSVGSSTVVLDAGETETINFFNFDTGFSCVPEPISFPTNLAVQAAGTSPGNDDIAVASNVVINGDVRSNDELEQIGGGTNRTINGSVTVVTTIDSGFVISGATSTGASPTGLPDANIPLWKTKAQEGGTVNGSFTFPNNTVGLVMGPTEINGNVTFGSSNSVTIRGPLYIHGDLTVGSNSTIIQDAGFGNQFTTIIVDGTIDISSNITFSGAGATGTFLLISTHAPVAGDDAAIETNSNNSDLGDVVLYASNGDIHINSNRTLLAIFASHGTESDSDDNAAIRLDSNVTVNYRTLPTTVSCGPRQPYESTSHVLINEFMPNPAGDDQGVAGGTLDGEWVEIFNPTLSVVDLSGYVLYDSINTHALPIVAGNTNTGATTIPSLGYLIVYRDGNTIFELNNSGGDTVRLFTDAIGSGGILVDSHTYTRDAPENKSFARVPDGSTNWIDPDATPGGVNWFFFDPMPGAPAFVPPNLPPLDITKDEPAQEEKVVGEGEVLGKFVEDEVLPIDKGGGGGGDVLDSDGITVVESFEETTSTDPIIDPPADEEPVVDSEEITTSTEDIVVDTTVSDEVVTVPDEIIVEEPITDPIDFIEPPAIDKIPPSSEIQ